MDKKDQEETDFEKASARITKTVMNWSIGLTLTTIFIAVAVWDCPHKQTDKKPASDSLKTKEVFTPQTPFK